MVAVGTGPTYANTINYVHAIKFVGSTANYLQISDASFLNGTDYTIMVLEKRQSSASNNYFLGETSSNPNDSLALGYSSDSTVIHAQGNQSYSASATVSSYASSTDKPRQFTFVHSSTAGNSTYINGILAAQDATKTAHLTGITSLAIGKGYTGEIGEIAIFARALKPEERQPIEDYAGKKWTRSINRSAVSGGSCIGYTITESGCDLSASPCSISVAGLVASVSPTSSSTSIACNQTNYSGSVNYTCVNGTASVSGSCTAAPPCSVTPTGVSAAITAASGSTGSGTCDVAHYTGTASFSCNSGTPTYISQCTCAMGYTGAGCSACDTGSGYQLVSGSCQKTCSVTAGSGTSTTWVAQGSGSVTCDSSGYSGSLAYSCASNGTLTVNTPCAQSCTGGTIDTTTIPGSVLHKFTTAGSFTFNCPTSKTVQVLVVGGGGGSGLNSGNNPAGGGGGGQVSYNASFSITASTPYTVTVGSGGAGGSVDTGKGTNGASSVFATITSIGGGGGGGGNGTGGANGSSGGGAGLVGKDTPGTGSAGFAGGKAIRGGLGGGGAAAGGGGGGAGAAGADGSGNGSPAIAGRGGNGIQNSITDTATYYGGGGSGGTSTHNNSCTLTTSQTNGSGGFGGGGALSANGTNGFGGGGGANCTSSGGSRSGGSGVVIVRY